MYFFKSSVYGVVGEMTKILILISILVILGTVVSIPTDKNSEDAARLENDKKVDEKKDTSNVGDDKKAVDDKPVDENKEKERTVLDDKTVDVKLELEAKKGTDDREANEKTAVNTKKSEENAADKKADDKQAVHDKAKKLDDVKFKASSNNSEDEIEDVGWEYENTTIADTRRILYSKRVLPGKRPYMVYLQLTKESAKAHKYRGWLCGGVIVDPHYVLTSAACVEDAEHFYIVSGTTKFVDSFDYKEDECVCKHRRRVIWKCIPKNYKFDFKDSIKWSSNDIAIVKVDKPFKLGVTEAGCQFGADCITYNNISRELEKPNTKGYIAGWGSGNNFREGVYRRQTHKPENNKCLQEAKVCVMDNEQCAKRWAQKFRNIITQYMICTKDVMRRISELCDKKYANCTDVETRRHVDDEPVPDIPSNDINVDLGRHLTDPDDYTARRSSVQGGFCENDHGGPLIVKYQGKERVIGVISACKIDPKSHSCHGPFLYTSVFKNRQFISCAIHKDAEENCRRVFRTGITHEEYSVDWSDVHPQAEAFSSTMSSAEDNVPRKVAVNAESSSLESDSTEKEPKKKAKSIEEKPKEDEEEPKEEIEEKEKKEKKSKKEKKKHKSGPKKVQNGNGEVFYESSQDDNVNEPDED